MNAKVLQIQFLSGKKQLIDVVCHADAIILQLISKIALKAALKEKFL
ncbi:MAG: hypothetical protein IPM82_25130 [Saprospiraceae bacterium]|nr:hypothetical protein [Saprospiraceae bacterium]